MVEGSPPSPLPHLLQGLEQSPLSMEQGTDLGRVLQRGSLLSRAQDIATLFSEPTFPAALQPLPSRGLPRLPGPPYLDTLYFSDLIHKGFRIPPPLTPLSPGVVVSSQQWPLQGFLKIPLPSYLFEMESCSAARLECSGTISAHCYLPPGFK